jgi:hypothetical protein
VVNKVVAQGKLMETCLDLLTNQIFKKPSVAVWAALTSLNVGMEADLATACQMDIDLASLCMGTEDFKEGVINKLVDKYGRLGAISITGDIHATERGARENLRKRFYTLAFFKSIHFLLFFVFDGGQLFSVEDGDGAFRAHQTSEDRWPGYVKVSAKPGSGHSQPPSAVKLSNNDRDLWNRCHGIGKYGFASVPDQSPGFFIHGREKSRAVGKPYDRGIKGVAESYKKGHLVRRIKIHAPTLVSRVKNLLDRSEEGIHVYVSYCAHPNLSILSSRNSRHSW